MNNRSIVCFLFACIVLVVGAYAKELEVGGFKIEVKEPWKMLSDVAREKTGLDAVWVNPETERPNAALLAKRLPKSVTEEADEMAASAKKQPAAIKLLEDRKVTLKDGSEARIVSLEILAGNEQLEIVAPMIFHSIYLPTEDGKSVTFKLHCAKTNLEVLKPAFEKTVLKELIPKPEK